MKGASDRCQVVRHLLTSVFQLIFLLAESRCQLLSNMLLRLQLCHHLHVVCALYTSDTVMYLHSTQATAPTDRHITVRSSRCSNTVDWTTGKAADLYELALTCPR